MIDTKVLLLIVIMALVTMFLRFIPFLIFAGRSTPKFIQYLGTFLPYSIMGMLIVYCVKDISFRSAPYGLAELLAIFIVVIFHRLKRNTLLSIIAGTVSYMLLIQFVF